MIYHLTSPRAWSEAGTRGEYRAESLESEGFIHCSTKTQILPVANTFYKGQQSVLLLEIDPSRLISELRWEPPSGAPPAGVPDGDAFPHIYGALNLNAVVHVYELESNPDGSYNLPVSE